MVIHEPWLFYIKKMLHQCNSKYDSLPQTIYFCANTLISLKTSVSLVLLETSAHYCQWVYDSYKVQLIICTCKKGGLVWWDMVMACNTKA